MLNILMFFTVYGVGFWASLFRNPVFAFVLYEAVYFFNPRQRWWGNLVPDISYSFFVVVLMIILIFLFNKEVKHNKLLLVPQFKWMYAVLFLYIIANLYAVLPESHYQASIDYLKLIVIVSVAYKLCDTSAKLDYVLYGYIFGAWYIGFVAFQTGRNSGARVEGIGTVDSPDSNGIAAAIAPAIVFCLYYFWISKNWLVKGLVVVAGVFIANGLILINSRGAFLAAAISVSYFMIRMYFSSFQRKYQKSIAVFIVVAGIAGTFSILDKGAIDRINSISNTEATEDKETGGTRLFFWRAAWEMAKDHPFGAGARGFNYYSPFYIPEDVDTGKERTRAVHSTWFEALTEIGYLGLFTLLIMLYSAFRALAVCKKELRKGNHVDEYFKIIAIEAALLAFVVSMSFLNRLRADVLYWLILYSACAYNIYVLRMKLENSNYVQGVTANSIKQYSARIS